MQLKELLLTKEELPILYNSLVTIPVHPRLFDSNIPTDIASKVLSEVVADYQKDMKTYLESQNVDEWIKRIHSPMPQLIQKDSRYVLGDMDNELFSFEYRSTENGLVNEFLLGAHFSLYISTNEHLDHDHLDSPEARGLNFSSKKISEFSARRTRGSCLIYFYGQHNIDTYPQALILRNWVMHYMNRVFQEVFPNGT